MKRQGFVATLVGTLLLIAPTLCPAALITMAVTGQVQGIIEGGNTAKGQKGSIVVLESSLGFVSPRDPASGEPTGRYQPQPVGLMKYLDPATPHLMQAFVNNEILTSVVLRFYRRTPAGTLENHFTIRLTNASLGSFGSDGHGANGTVKETLTLYWQQMEMRDELRGVSTVVYWAAPPA